MDFERISWTETDPERVEHEKQEMARLAPDMEWRARLRIRQRDVVGWEGLAPEWPADRPAPNGLTELLEGKRLRLQVGYLESYPMVEPVLIPLDPDPPIQHRTMQEWHVMGDGSLCLLQEAEDWQPTHTAADLVAKASGWFIEYRLMELNKLDRMTERGILSDPSLDGLIAEFAS